MTIELIIECDRCGIIQKIKYSWKDMINSFFDSYNYLFHIRLPIVLNGWKTSSKDNNLCPDCVKQYEMHMRNFK